MILRHTDLNRQSTPFYTMLCKEIGQKNTNCPCPILMRKQICVYETPGRRTIIQSLNIHTGFTGASRIYGLYRQDDKLLTRHFYLSYVF